VCFAHDAAATAAAAAADNDADSDATITITVLRLQPSATAAADFLFSLSRLLLSALGHTCVASPLRALDGSHVPV
jgi:hypothetical protein